MHDENPMTDEEFLEDRRMALRESIDYFSADKKQERERWVCAEFIENLGMSFDESEVLSPEFDPPDVAFRDARFEIKEVLDPGRRRHDEYKALYQKAMLANDPQDLLTMYTPRDITPVQIGELVVAELESLKARYAPAVMAQLDLLLYVNLKHHLLKQGPMPSTSSFASFGWRSVSALFGWSALVLSAGGDSPSFLSGCVGTITLRKFV